MIAVSVVHGGPGPNFLSEDLVHYLAGQTSFKPTVNLITDAEIRKALHEVRIACGRAEFTHIWCPLLVFNR